MDRLELQIIWVVGTLERMASVGILKNMPMKVSKEYVDLYMCLDPGRLFLDEEELLDIFEKVVISGSNFSSPPSEAVLKDIGKLVLEYKKDPLKIAQLGLINSENKS